MMLVALIFTVLLQVTLSQNPYLNANCFGNPYDANRIQDTIDGATGRTKAVLSTVQGTATPFWIAQKQALSAGWTENFLEAAAAEDIKQLVTLVVYNLPNRDCSAYAGGGEICCLTLSNGQCDNSATTGGCTAGVAEYKEDVIDPLYELVDQYDELLDIVIILEPDAMANLASGNCGAETVTFDAYKEAIAYAIRKFADTSSTVYIDGGHPGWENEDDVINAAAILSSMNFEWDMIRGFSLNLANSMPLGTWCGDQADVVRYCVINPNDPCCADPCGRKKDTNNVLNFAQLFRTTFLAKSGSTFSPHMLVDTSRNGVDVCTEGWCNIRDQGIGRRPTPDTDAPDLVDAYLWIKIIGDSDGCTRYLPDNTLCPAFDEACASDESIGSRPGEPRAPLPGQLFPYLLETLANNAVWAGEICGGPYAAPYTTCENRIEWILLNRPSAWMVKRGIDGTRCSIQGFLHAQDGNFCPASPNDSPSPAPVSDPTAPEPCSGPFDSDQYPKCTNKIDFQRSSSWYVARGLDGSKCSLQGYFADTGECPPLDSYTPTTEPTAALTEVDCPGPFSDAYPLCENKIMWHYTNRDSAWFAKKGLDGSRCTLIQYIHNKDGSCPAAPSKAPVIDPTVAPSRVDCPGPFEGYADCEKKITWALANRDQEWFDQKNLDGSRCALQLWWYNRGKGECPTVPCSGPYSSQYSTCKNKINHVLENRTPEWMTSKGIDGSRCSIQQYWYDKNKACPSTTFEPYIGVFYFYWTTAIVLPPGANLGVGYSGRGDVEDALTLTSNVYSDLPGDKFLSIGGVPEGVWSAATIDGLNTAIAAGDLVAYSGISYMIMEGDTGLSGAFATSFALAKSKGLSVLVTFSHTGPYGIADNVELVEAFLADDNIDIISPRLFDLADETENNYDEWPVSWSQFAVAKAKIVPCIVGPALYADAQEYFAALSIEIGGYIQWGQDGSP